MMATSFMEVSKGSRLSTPSVFKLYQKLWLLRRTTCMFGMLLMMLLKDRERGRRRNQLDVFIDLLQDLM